MTILVRTEKGKQIFDEALDAGYIEARELSTGDIEKIKSLALLKFEKGVSI